MYDLPQARDLTDGWWTGLYRHFTEVGIRDVPAHLHRPTAVMPHWLDESLLFSQTCGYPLTHALKDNVTLIGTPAYSAPGCHGSDYSSALLVRADAQIGTLGDLRGGVVACNARDSHSGYNVLRAMVAPLARDGRFFANVRITGSHANSVALIREGGADVCAVDAVTYALLERYAPAHLDATRRLAWSASAPGLPYITCRAATPTLRARLQAGIAAAFADPLLEEVRNGLFLNGFECLTETDYLRISELEKSAKEQDYSILN